MNKNKMILIIIFIFFVIMYFTFKTSRNIEPTLKVVEVVKIDPQRIEQTVRLIGTVRAKHSTMLMSKSTGVLEILKQSGEHVNKGMLIARILNSDIEKRYELASSMARIAKEQYERTLILVKTGASSKQAAEEKQLLLFEAEHRLATAKIELDKIRFYAPFDGIVGAYKEQNGTEIKNEMPLLSFYDPMALIVELDIPAPLLALVNVGQKVLIEGELYKLAQVQKMLDPLTHMAPATINIKPDGHIIGMSVNVDITIFQKENAIVLLDEAVFLNQGRPHVYIIKDSKTILTPVELGLRAKDKVEIKKGVSKGDIIVSQGQGRLSDKMKVKILSSNNVKQESNVD